MQKNVKYGLILLLFLNIGIYISPFLLAVIYKHGFFSDQEHTVLSLNPVLDTYWYPANPIWLASFDRNQSMLEKTVVYGRARILPFSSIPMLIVSKSINLPHRAKFLMNSEKLGKIYVETKSMLVEGEHFDTYYLSDYDLSISTDIDDITENILAIKAR